ncbi:SAM-dependent methyltransferase [Paracoccus rhizosphaerae]|uniref:SAM-dependent methyltransferase n=1 Tax=Paracoccus rhizosphaerae TaxID=1133347 RepID=A0ABV6CKF2_9RHOB|nr:SAM-dependent methyltransferase [Paracoccus rhizosphaerae]
MPLESTLRHLDSLYAGSDDPWNHRTSPYEQSKFAATLAAVGEGPFRNALEIGCGNGTLLALLAPRCHRLIGVDCIPRAVALARKAVAEHPHVSVCEACIPAELPALQPDLVLLSEVLYFLGEADIHQLAAWLLARRPRIVCVNWLGSTDESQDGTSAMQIFQTALGTTGRTTIHDRYRIDVFD